ncbi:hypothetical protein GPECTOR_11g13 [Gonium pectorale]|uniref:LisH domain-containing protein n=1 Tax=Gonium pectorale TaxID=33097 RepID=A0A150GPM1_GONPE|nr:hypothetical protein GPECTOR_11g13 [Gonium pectorale]|eukprot:KXZ51678.1 hypothetical protein GPECTOR_11g13 [Gonium pectorale]
MEAARTASGVPLLPRAAGPLVDTQAVRELLSTISGGGFSAQLSAAAGLAALLEAEEGRFRDVVGDPWAGPAGQRQAHSIGKLLACVKDRESVYDTVCESWVLSRSAPLEQQVAGLRLVLACLSCWAFQYPLTEDRCMELLHEWAGEAGDETPTPSDPPPADEQALLREARSVYATGLLSIAMTNEDLAGQASSSALVPRVAKYLRQALLDKPPAAAAATAGGSGAAEGPAGAAVPPAPPSHALDAPNCVTKRMTRREAVGGHGGRGGARADRQLIYSRFRPLRTFRDDGSLTLCAAFMQASGLGGGVRGWRRLLAGTHEGELKLYDPLDGPMGHVDVVDAHAGPVTQLRVHDRGGNALLLSCSRTDVKLWAAPSGGAGGSGGTVGPAVPGGGGADEGPLPRAPKATWDGVTRPRFNTEGTQVVAVSSTAPRQALIFDVRTAAKVAVLDPPPPLSAAGGGGGPSPGGVGGGRTPLLPGLGRAGGAIGLAGILGGGGGGESRRAGRGGGGPTAAACYSPTGNMLLWGNCLYDLRSGTAVHQFDQFTDSGSGAFHPAGLESRRQLDEPLQGLFHPRRARHPLHAAFRTLDAATYADIATVAVERVVLDLAVEPTDSLVAVVAVDLADEELSSAARVYEVGRRRPADDESDADEDDEEDSDDSDGGSEDEDEDEDEDMDFGGLDAPRRRGGGGGGRRATARRLIADIFGEADVDDVVGGGGAAAAGGAGGAGAAASSDGGEGDDEEGEDGIDNDDDDGGTDDEEMGMAMLEDAYAALEDAYGDFEEFDDDDDDDDEDEDEEEEDEDEDMEDGDEEGGAGGEEAELQAFLRGQMGAGVEDGESEEEEDEEDDSDDDQ